MDADDEVAISVERVLQDGCAQYIGTLTVNDGLPVELVLFRRIVPVSCGHTEESAKQLAYNDCLKFCYHYNPDSPGRDTGTRPAAS